MPSLGLCALYHTPCRAVQHSREELAAGAEPAHLQRQIWPRQTHCEMFPVTVVRAHMRCPGEASQRIGAIERIEGDVSATAMMSWRRAQQSRVAQDLLTSAQRRPGCRPAAAPPWRAHIVAHLPKHPAEHAVVRTNRLLGTEAGLTCLWCAAASGCIQVQAQWRVTMRLLSVSQALWGHAATWYEHCGCGACLQAVAQILGQQARDAAAGRTRVRLHSSLCAMKYSTEHGM